MTIDQLIEKLCAIRATDPDARVRVFLDSHLGEDREFHVEEVEHNRFSREAILTLTHYP